LAAIFVNRSRPILSFLLSFILFFAIGCTAKKSVSKFKPFSEPNGFNGITWGTDIKKVKVEKNMNFHGVQNKLEMYVIENDDLLFGDVRVRNIGYGFFKNRFAKVDIVVIDVRDYEKLKKEAFSRFGEVKKTANDRYFWEGQESVAIMGSQEIIILTIFSRQLMLEIDDK